MGISAEIADIIVAEHAVRPLPKEVHLLGRQTVYVSLETCLALCRKYGVVPRDTEVQLDTSTVGAIQHSSELYVTDSTFFGLLGVEKISAIDHSDYEGAQLVIDLRQPLEKQYRGIASFIFGGSVLDNVFDPRRYIENVSLLLTEGGRLMDANMISHHFHAYITASPAWYYDFFAANGFQKLSLVAVEGPYVYSIVPDASSDMAPEFGIDRGVPLGLLIFAEKGTNFDIPIIPNQDQYRSANEWGSHRRKASLMTPFLDESYVFTHPSEKQLSAFPPRRANRIRLLGVHEPLSSRDFDRNRYIKQANSRQLPFFRILEATFGENVSEDDFIRTGSLPVMRGNVTSIIQNMTLECSRETPTFLFNRIYGDPAPGCQKDLRITYCSADAPNVLKEIYVEAEAFGKTISLNPY